MTCYTERYNWGDAAHFWPQGQDGKIVGWSPRCPKRGDLFRYYNEEGEVVTRTIVKVTRPGDPPDMWFAELNDPRPWHKRWFR